MEPRPIAATATNDTYLYRHAFVWLPLLLGVASLLLGQDDNWDLRNYHLYNPYAWLHDRLHTDLAPAGLQSYFNPLLDVFQAGLFRWLPAPLVGFLLGWLQGLNAILLIAIGRHVLPPGSPPRRVIGLAAAGCTAASFLSELGNTMGDNLTALCVLSGLLLTLGSDAPRDRHKLLAAGGLLGLATGLKLTNAVYAVGLASTLLLVPAQRDRRFMPALLFGLGGLAGLLLTSGYWFWHLWQAFGNPLFPQFGAVFHNPLAADAGVADVRSLPRHLGEWLLWPLVLTLDSYRLGQKTEHQLAWPVLYVLYLAWAAGVVRRRGRAEPANGLGWPARRLAGFVAISFVVWMAVFSIYRYLVPLELLVPLLSWVLLQQLLPARWSVRASTWVVVAVAAVGLSNYWNSWGHALWATPAFRVEQPALPSRLPTQTTVLLVGDEAMAWRIPFLPQPWAYVGVSTNFPAGRGYASRIRQMLRQRAGPVRIMLPAATYPRANHVARLNLAAGYLGLSQGAGGCARLAWVRRHAHLRAQLASAQPQAGCRFVLGDTDRIDLQALDHATEQRALAVVASLGLTFLPSSCERYRSAIGQSSYPYLWCVATPLR